VSGNTLVGVRDVTMEALAKSLYMLGLGRPVIDRTGLEGSFDFTLEWTPEAVASDSSAPVVGLTPVEALRDQLGLKLETARASVPILVVDRVERPSEN
jgi:uncharacterized protein (TIGR03435 family)